jgi:hypothetical protein
MNHIILYNRHLLKDKNIVKKKMFRKLGKFSKCIGRLTEATHAGLLNANNIISIRTTVSVLFLINIIELKILFYSRFFQNSNE